MGGYGMLGDRGLPVSNDMGSSQVVFHFFIYLREMLANQVLLDQ
jgi:hypothetical protein